MSTVSAPTTAVSTPSTRTVPLREAADALGVGVTTARRWVRSGRLKGHRIRAREGDVWYVELPPDAGAPAAPAAPEAPPDGALRRPATAAPSEPVTAEAVASAETPTRRGTPRLARAEEAVVRLEAHVADLRQTVTRLETELDARRREGQVLLAVLGRAVGAPALAAPSDDPADSGAAGPSTPSVEGPAEGSTEGVETTVGVEPAETASGGVWARLRRWLTGG